MADYASRNTITPAVKPGIYNPQRSELLSKLLLQMALQNQGSYRAGDPPAVAWQPAMNMLAAALAGKKADREEAASSNRLADVLRQATSPVEEMAGGQPAEVLPEGVSGPTRLEIPGTPVSRPRTADEVISVLGQVPEGQPLAQSLLLKKLENQLSPKAVNRIDPAHRQVYFDPDKKEWNIGIIGENNVFDPVKTPSGKRAIAPQWDPYERASSSARGKAHGGAQGEAETQLPDIALDTSEIHRLTDELLKHPGRQYAIGIGGVVPGAPNTAHGDFTRRFEQVKSSAFRMAYETLKGGGQITEYESKTAAQALNRMERSTTQAEFESAAKDFLRMVDIGFEKIQRKAGGRFGDTSPLPERSPSIEEWVRDPKTGKLRRK